MLCFVLSGAGLINVEPKSRATCHLSFPSACQCDLTWSSCACSGFWVWSWIEKYVISTSFVLYFCLFSCSVYILLNSQMQVFIICKYWLVLSWVCSEPCPSSLRSTGEGKWGWWWWRCYGGFCSRFRLGGREHVSEPGAALRNFQCHCEYAQRPFLTSWCLIWTLIITMYRACQVECKVGLRDLTILYHDRSWTSPWSFFSILF